MKDNDSAFPVFEETRAHSDGSACTDYMLASPGMTLRQYAAIKLRVPRSGDPGIDAMIRESRRAEFAEAAMQGMLAGQHGVPMPQKDGSISVYDHFSFMAFRYADAMLAEWERKT
jgi:hypothetical protein